MPCRLHLVPHGRSRSRLPAHDRVIDPGQHFLYLTQNGGKAIRYGVGVGREGYGWSGVATVHSKQEWPDWYPTEQYLQEHPQVRPHLVQLQSGMGVHGGPQNPLGARAMYLWQRNKDTLYRIHGTNEPWTIGKNVSAGCIRLINDDMIDLTTERQLAPKLSSWHLASARTSLGCDE